MQVAQLLVRQSIDENEDPGLSVRTSIHRPFAAVTAPTLFASAQHQ
jgi:hypothetical protein